MGPGPTDPLVGLSPDLGLSLTETRKPGKQTPHLDTPLLQALREEKAVAICALHPQEAVGGVAIRREQHFVPEHGIDHGALPIARPIRKPSEATAICMSCH